MKKGVIYPIVLLAMINFVSAYNGGLGDFLDVIDQESMILGAVFIISFAVLNFALSRVFRDSYGNPNKATAGIVSFALSLLITYGVNHSGFDIENLFFDVGVSSDILYTAIPIILLAGIIYMIATKKLKYLLMGLGGLFIILSYFAYEKGILIVAGVVLLLIGLWMWWRARHPRESRGYDYGRYGDYDYGYREPRGPSQRKLYTQRRRDQKGEQRLERQQKRYEEREHTKEVRKRARKLGKIARRREIGNKAKKYDKAKQIMDEYRSKIGSKTRNPTLDFSF